MVLRVADPLQGSVGMRIAVMHLPLQMPPFVVKLISGDVDSPGRQAPLDLLPVKLISPPHGFFVHHPQVELDCTTRRGRGTEPDELRMTAISLRLSREHLSCQKRFPPESNNAPGVQMFWMEGPESHRIAARV